MPTLVAPPTIEKSLAAGPISVGRFIASRRKFGLYVPGDRFLQGAALFAAYAVDGVYPSLIADFTLAVYATDSLAKYSFDGVAPSLVGDFKHQTYAADIWAKYAIDNTYPALVADFREARYGS